MNKAQFSALFESALNQAADNARAQTNRPNPRHFIVKLYGAGHGGDLMTPDQAIEALYISDDKFYRIIDVSATDFGIETATFFVRASDHEPSSFDKTWNKPPGSGPFKQLIAQNITFSD
jgi:hypothetical protein